MRTIVLVGGNEFRPNCNVMDEQLLRLAPRIPPRILIIPTAAAHERPELAVQNGVHHFSALGGSAKGLMALNRADWEYSADIRALDDADVIYLTGGDPSYLFRTTNGTSLVTAVLARCDAGTVLAGSSAGAMVLGEWMRERGGGWVRGLGMLPGIAVIPHYRSTGSLDVRSVRSNLPDDVAILGIGEATGCVSRDGGRWDVIGENAVEVIGPTGLQDYRHGQSFLLP
jgi:cyanophycinase